MASTKPKCDSEFATPRKKGSAKMRYLAAGGFDRRYGGLYNWCSGRGQAGVSRSGSWSFTMHRPLFAAIACVAVSLAGSAANAALTIEEALTLSQQTGRPIFAVAGSET